MSPNQGTDVFDAVRAATHYLHGVVEGGCSNPQFNSYTSGEVSVLPHRSHLLQLVNRWWEGVQIGRTEGMVYGVVCIHLVYCVYLQVVCLCVKNPPWFIAGFCRWSSGVDMTNLSVVEPCGRCWSSSLLMQKTFSRCFVRDIYMPHLIWVSAVNSATQKKKREKESKCRINMVILTLEAYRGTCMVNIGSVRRLWSCI